MRILSLLLSLLLALPTLADVPASQPATVAKAPAVAAPRPVYFATSEPLVFTVPPGTLPLVSEPGGRYDADPAKPGWQEDSFWVGGYYGPRKEIDSAKAARAWAWLPPGVPYVFDVEEPEWDARVATDAQVEHLIRRSVNLRNIAKAARPDVPWGQYGLIPPIDFWVCQKYGAGVRQWDRYVAAGRDERKLTDRDRYWLAGVATRDPKTGAWALDERAEYTREFRRWQAATDRLTFGRFANGRENKSAGIDDISDRIYPSLYKFYPGTDDGNGDFVRLTIAEAKRVAGGRPVYPFVWPVYHDGNAELGGKPIPLGEWRWLLRTISEAGADGVVIWGIKPGEYPEHVRVVLEEAARR